MTTESEVREEPVLVLNDKKYLISELSDEAKAFVVEINIVDQETGQAKRALDRLVLAKEGYTNRLLQIFRRLEIDFWRWRNLFCYVC